MGTGQFKAPHPKEPVKWTVPHLRKDGRAQKQWELGALGHFLQVCFFNNIYQRSGIPFLGMVCGFSVRSHRQGLDGSKQPFTVVLILVLVL